MAESELRADEKILLGSMQRYRSEIKAASQRILSPEELASSHEWISTLEAFADIIENARKINAKVLVVMFYGRGGMYFERATGRRLPAQWSDYAERDLLKEFCRQKGVLFLDVAPVFQTYVAALEENTPIREYPYLRYDGHPSPKGHQLIAEAIAKFLARQGNSAFNLSGTE